MPERGCGAGTPRAGSAEERGGGLGVGPGAAVGHAQWLERLPEKKKPLYTHSLPCIEAWLRSLGFTQSREDPAVWVAEKPLWHARLSLDVTDLHIRYCMSVCASLLGDSIHARSLTKMLLRFSLLDRLM